MTCHSPTALLRDRLFAAACATVLVTAAQAARAEGSTQQAYDPPEVCLGHLATVPDAFTVSPQEMNGSCEPFILSRT